MSASAKQKRHNFNQGAFRKGVFEFYSTTRDVDGTKFEYCHLCGWLPEKMVNPKSLVGDELSYLFGEGEVVLMNPRNGNDTRFLLLLFKLRAHGC